MTFRIAAVFLFYLLLISCGPTEVIDSTIKPDSLQVRKVDSFREGLLFPVELKSIKKTAYEEFWARSGDSIFICGYKGKVEMADTAMKFRSFLFDLKAEFLIDKVYILKRTDETFFVVWQETNHMGVRTWVGLFKRGNSTPVWSKEYKAPSPGQPVVDSNYAYVTTLGIIAKLNVDNGEYVWMHDSLFDPIKLKYKKFDSPLIYKSSACFYDIPIPGRKNKRDSIWLNAETGVFIR